MEGLLGEIIVQKNRLQKVWQLVRIDEKRKKVIELQSEMAVPDFWQDQEKAKKISQEASDLETEVAEWESLKHDLQDLYELVEMGESDPLLQKNAKQQLRDLEKNFDKLEFNLLFREKYDTADAMITIHAGAGGTDAQDWAEMLLRMYLRFCESRRWKTQIISISPGNEAGVKSVLIEVFGRNSYGYLKSESGVHRLVRISPFDAEKMRHTSFAMVEVLPMLDEVEGVQIKSEELRVDTYHAGGHGGQGVNTTDSAVRITHLPTKIVVTCQNERSQQQNRETAMKILKSKLQKYYEAEQEEERQLLRGEYTEAAWGRQARSYVIHPYKLVKDHRTEFETTAVEKVLDGDLMMFVEAYLRKNIRTEEHKNGRT